MKQLILGGVRSGKSRLAEKLALSLDKSVIYVATATVGDDEMADRIQSHKESRPSDWGLVEETLSLGAVIDASPNENTCLLIDCLTLWMTNLLCKDDPQRLEDEIASFLRALANTQADIIMVSNETGLGVVPMGELSRQFCDRTGVLHQSVAEQCDRVVMTIAGLPQVLKGDEIEF